jgi:SpoVK/Ycf46/Vps4 family AAA+-type ATPase
MFSGWNAGGEVIRLAAGMPEAWATSSVHMFLTQLDLTISNWLQRLILAKFGAQVSSSSKFGELIDVDVTFPGDLTKTLKSVAEEHLTDPVSSLNHSSPESIRRSALTSRRSALLFGPPGTSKTSFAKAVAGKLGWPVIVVTPSDFLNEGLERIYVRVSEIFKDLMDLSAVVILFDEMDALGQKRGDPALDVTRQLLTTSMLPKLADLHDMSRVIFFMNTNHQRDLDPAITRPGRFDLLLCVGPPRWERKLDGLSQIVKDADEEELTKIRSRLKSLASEKTVQRNLDVFTVADLANFMEHLKRTENTRNLLSALKGTTKRKFEEQVLLWSNRYRTLNTSEKHLLDEYTKDQDASRIQ